MGPLPRSYNNKKYIIIAIDTFSLFMITDSVKNKNADNIAQFNVKKIFLLHEIPKTILSDQGNEFTNKIITNITKILK